jgi:hypothetical protein
MLLHERRNLTWNTTQSLVGKPSRHCLGYQSHSRIASKFVDTIHPLGWVAMWASQPEDNSALAAMLIDLGAVLYCKTNLPQSIMTGDSDNNVFGRTLNPRNELLTAGGSTGGEGALLALRGAFSELGRISVAAFVSHQSAMESMDSGLA